MPSCRMLPHGVYSLLPAVLTTMAWMASLFQDGCDYAQLTGDLVDELAVVKGTPYLEVGFAAYREPSYNAELDAWQTLYTGKCLKYPDDSIDVDGKWKVAKGFAFLALVLGGGGTFFLWFSTCCIFSRGTWKWAGYEVLFAAIFQMLAFVWFSNGMCNAPGTACDLFWGSKADIVATVFWSLAALLIFCKYPEPNDTAGDGIILQEGEVDPSVNLRDGNGGEGTTVETAAPEDAVMSSGEDPQQGADVTEESSPSKKDLSEVEII